MSSDLIGVGHRLLTIRTKHRFPQSKVAAMLGISDRSYKNYELEKRDLPLAIAKKFCEKFQVSLNWLVYGEVAPSLTESEVLAGESAQGVYEFAVRESKAFTGDEVNKYVRYIFRQSATKGSSPIEETELFFSAIG